MAFALGARTGVFTGPDALAAQNLVEGGAVLAVAVADHEAHPPIAEVETKIARLLGDSGAARVRRTAPRTRRDGVHAR
jgi:hypothetical protein